MTPTMQRPSRATLLTMALLSTTILAIPAGASAQTTQTVQVVLKVPVRMTHIFPEVTDVAIRCRIWSPSQQIGDEVSAWTPLSQLQRGTDGSLTGEVSVTVPVTMFTADAGKTATYQCYMQGRAGPNTFGTFAGSFPNVWFQIIAPNVGDGIAQGSFTL